MKAKLHNNITIFSFFILVNFFSLEKSFAQSFNNSQLVTKAWTRIDGNPSDTLNITNQTLDKNKDLLTIGNTVSGSIDMLLTKYNGSTGSIIWQKQYDNSSHNDYGVAVVTDTNNYVYAATTSYVSSTNGYDWVIQRYKPNGFLLWTVTFNSGLYDAPVDMKYDNAGYLYVTGIRTTVSTLADYCTLKFNASNGSQVWSSPSYYDYASLLDIAAAITTVTSTKIAVTGASASSANNYDIASILYNKNTGAQLSVTRSASNGLGFDQATAVAKDQYDNIYVTGSAQVSGTGADIKIVKLDTALNTVWSVTWDGDSLADGANSIGVDGYGYIYVTGFTKKANGGSDYITLKYKNTGTLQWAKTYSAPDTTKSAIAKKLDIDPYGNILIVGDIDNISNRDILTLAYDTGGNKIWEDWYIGRGDDLATSILLQDGTKTFYVTGKTWVDTGFQYLTIKYSMVDYITPPDTEDCPFSFAYYENKGQIMGTNDTLQSQIKYYTLHHYPNVYFADDRQSFVFAHIDTFVATDDTLHRIDLTFQNGFTTKVSNAWERTPWYLNYFKPWCPAGVTPVHGYPRLLYPEVYRNTDFMVYANGAGLKYYFIVKPGGNPSNIIMKFTGADTIKILSDSTLEILSSIGSFTFEAPTAFQIDINYNIINLNSPATYSSAGVNKIDFDYPSYDNTKPLIIEMKRGNSPLRDTDNVHWATYIGGSNGLQLDVAWDVYTDDSNNVYVTGTAGNPNFPTTLGAYHTNLAGDRDAFVTKFSNQDSLVASTFIGGANTTFPEEASRSVRVDGQGRIFIAGYSGSSSTFPTWDADSSSSADYFDSSGSGTHRTPFITCFSPDLAQLIWSTFLDDPTQYINEAAYGLAIDRSDNIYVVGQNALPGSVSGPVGSYQQVYGITGTIAMFNPSFEVQWATYFGGYTGGNIGYYGGWTNDIIYACAVDEEKRLYITGKTGEPVSLSTCDDPINSEFPICNSIGGFSQPNFGGVAGTFDAFIARFDSLHQLEWSTYIGAEGDDQAFDIDINDNSKLIAIVGQTTSDSFPVYNAYQSTIGSPNEADAFIVRFSDAGALISSTYLGGSDFDAANGVAFDHSPGYNLFVTGVTGSSDFPYQENGSYYHNHQFGTEDAFISSLDFNNSLLWSTDYGGTLTNPSNLTQNTSGTACAVNYDGSLYVVGSTNCADLPIVYSGGQYHQVFGNCPTCNPVPKDDDAFICEFDVSNITGIAEHSLTENSINLFPNPTSGDVTIVLNNLNNQKINQIMITDIEGRMLRSIELNNSTQPYTFNVSNFASGIYFLIFETSDNSLVKKFIKQ